MEGRRRRRRSKQRRKRRHEGRMKEGKGKTSLEKQTWICE
jgi:hypothetical protein